MNITDTKPTVNAEAQAARDHFRSGLDLSGIVAIWEGIVTLPKDGIPMAALFVVPPNGKVVQHTVSVTRPGCYTTSHLTVSNLYSGHVYTHGPDMLQVHSVNYMSRWDADADDWVFGGDVTITGQVYGMAPAEHLDPDTYWDEMICSWWDAERTVNGVTSQVTILVRSHGEILAYGEPADGQVEYRLIGDVLPHGSYAVTAEDIAEMCAATDLGALDGLPVRRDTA